MNLFLCTHTVLRCCSKTDEKKSGKKEKRKLAWKITQPRKQRENGRIIKKNMKERNEFRANQVILSHRMGEKREKETSNK